MDLYLNLKFQKSFWDIMLFPPSSLELRKLLKLPPQGFFLQKQIGQIEPCSKVPVWLWFSCSEHLVDNIHLRNVIEGTGRTKAWGTPVIPAQRLMPRYCLCTLLWLQPTVRFSECGITSVSAMLAPGWCEWTGKGLVGFSSSILSGFWMG